MYIIKYRHLVSFPLLNVGFIPVGEIRSRIPTIKSSSQRLSLISGPVKVQVLVSCSAEARMPRTQVASCGCYFLVPCRPGPRLISKCNCWLGACMVLP